jgi:hypothetical protein
MRLGSKAKQKGLEQIIYTHDRQYFLGEKKRKAI